MRGHALPARCPRCGEPALPARDDRLIECPGCRLAYDWLRHTEGSAAGPRRGELPTLDPPDGLVTRQDGKTLVLVLPPTRSLGVAMLAIALACGATAVAMSLASNLPLAGLLIALAAVCGALGVVFVATRLRLTVTPTELVVDRVPFRGKAVTIPLRELRQLAIARTRRGRDQLLYDTELFAQLTDRDVHLLTTGDQNLARYVEQRLEYHLAIVDDGVEMVVPGAE